MSRSTPSIKDKLVMAWYQLKSAHYTGYQKGLDWGERQRKKKEEKQ